MAKKIKRWILRPVVRYPVLILLCILIGIGIYALNASVILGNRFPMPFGYGFSAILSGSMEPTLSAGDMVLIKEQDSYSVGDIVAYQYGTIGVVHRIIRIEGDSAITQGDANNIEDNGIPLNIIKGRVIWSIPVVGEWIVVLKSPISILALILAAVLLLELSFRADKEKKKAETEKLKEEIQQLKTEMLGLTRPL